MLFTIPFSEDVITVVGVVLAVPALWFAAVQVRHAKDNTRMQALLQVETLLEQHSDVHLKLRPGGDWSKAQTGPRSTEEWVSVETYMGLFERVKVAMLDSGTLDIKDFDRMYGYRILNIDANDLIRRSKLEGALAPHWADFIQLRDAVRESRDLPARPTAPGLRPSPTAPRWWRRLAGRR